MGSDKEAQIERFKETARALGCDEDETVFDEKLRVIARQKPKPLSSIDKPDDAIGKKK